MKIIQLLKQHGASLDATHPTDKKALTDFQRNVLAEEFKDCFPEFCKILHENKTSSWNSSLAKQFPFLQGWFTFASPSFAQELQVIHANENHRQIHSNKQIKKE
jgi:superfamily I DNA and RNA helicase